MDANPFDTWSAVISESSPMAIDKLSKIVNLANPPDFYEFVCNLWQLRKENAPKPWDLLMESQIMLQAVGHPSALDINQAVRLTKMVMEDDVLFDMKLLRRLLANRIWPDEVPSAEVMRALTVLETLDEMYRLSMTLLKFSKFPDRRVQSKVAKILGRCVESVEILDELFQNPDGRVRANLIEGIGRREAIDACMPLIERATRDQHTRVSSIALAIRARLGHGGSNALIKMRLNSKMEDIRGTAEFAQRIAINQVTGRDIDGEKIGESSLDSLNHVYSLSVVDPEPTVGAAIEEVHGQA